MIDNAIVWEGAFYRWHSLAHVNRELGRRLLEDGSLSAILPLEREADDEARFPELWKVKHYDPSEGSPLLTIRHSYPPIAAPSPGGLVVMQPWEFFSAPEEWVHFFASPIVHELWVNSSFTRAAYVTSGVPPEKVRVMPLGFDANIFTPNGPKQALDEAEEFRFFYGGGTISRKGIDILLDAYLAEFGPEDPVRLVIKDSGWKSVYLHNNIRDEIMRRANDPTGARITYFDEDVSAPELASLMRSCHAVVQPYRAEGFCLPLLEGMATGLCPIATQGGPSDDYHHTGVGWKIAAERVEIEPIPGHESTRAQAWLEPNFMDLRQALKWAAENPERAREHGTRASQSVSHLTWNEAAGVYSERIREISEVLRHRTRPRSTISLCMIVKDEERVIRDCMNSVQGRFEEIIVLDTGSNDKTPSILAEYQVQLRLGTWKSSFATARNESMEGASSDWVMWIDADDTVPERTIDTIKEAVRNASWDVIGFVVPVRFVESEGPGTEVDHVKVFRNLPGISWEGRIHEQILPSLRAAAEREGLPGGGRLVRLDAHVLHSGYDTSEAGQAKKRQRDEKLLQLDLQDRPNHPFVLFNLGMTAHYSADHEEAVAWLERCLSKSQPAESHVRKAYALLGGSLRHLGRVDEARDRLLEGLQRTGGDPEIQFYLAQLASESGRIDEAIARYESVIGTDISGFFTSIDPGILGYKTRHNLALCYIQANNYPMAREHWLKSLEETGKEDFALNLHQHALLNGDLATASEIFSWVEDRHPDSPTWAVMAGGGAQAVGLDVTPIYLEALKRAPSNLAVRKALSLHLLNTKRGQSAIEHLTLLDEADVPEGAFFLGVLAEESGHPEDAIRHFSRALSLNPAHDETRKRLQRLRSL